MNDVQIIVILPDGETWAPLDGCEVVVITEKGIERLNNGEKLADLGSDCIPAAIGMTRSQ